MRIPNVQRVIGTPDHRLPWRPPVRLVGLLEQLRTWPTRPYRLA